MSTYSDIPVSLASGLPEINIPLLSVPMADKAIGYPLSISYNLNNLIESETAGDVGAGWSFFGTGVIYKKIVDGLDECYDMPSWPTHYNNEFDDVYYYNFPGASGKFRIKRDVTNNTFSLINLTPDHTKIEYLRDNTNTSTFKANSFSITTDNGYKYIFNEFDYGQYGCSNYYEGSSLGFKSAYFLTKIISPLGIEVANMEYEKKSEINNGVTFSQYCKLKSVTTSSGTVLLDYVYEDALKKTVNDPYSLQKITVKNPAGQNIYSYDLSYSIATSPSTVSERKRMLNFIRKNDKNGQKTEQTSFVYTSEKGMLTKVISPTGGTTEYTYENNEQFFDLNDPAYLDYIDQYVYDPNLQTSVLLNEVSLNSDQNLTYHFTVPGDITKNKYLRCELTMDVEFPPSGGGDTGLPENPNSVAPSAAPVRKDLRFTLKRDNEKVQGPLIINSYKNYFNISKKPGNYTIEITSNGGVKGIGDFKIFGANLKPGPFRNASTASGYRIRNTKFYKNAADTSPERTINYEYDSFDQPNSTSGYQFYNEADANEYSSSSYIIYKNVKVSETGKGYIKNRFKTANDYPKYQTGGTTQEPIYFWPYYRVSKQGLPFKKEIYDEQNHLLASEESEFELDYYSTDEYKISTANGQFFSKPAYVKKSVNKSITYYNDGKKLESSSETQIEGNSFKPVYTKSVVDGDVSERLMTYPVNLPGYNQLETAYMTGSPVIVEEKQNGKTLSKATTKYNASSLLPSSIVSTNINDGSIKEHMKMDLYDDKGNLLQVTNAADFPTAFVYGYNKTQVIAKVEGAIYAQISSLVSAIITASDNDNLNGNTEPALILALDNFRKNPALADYLITTYTYNPLIGLTSMTSPSGMREMYEYDDAGRLKITKRVDEDNSGTSVPKKVKEYQYNYK
ncbi:hypothetical protein AMQ68_09755 [Chryseobacterium sp. ERMR1:04]|nr:hypothetical protein AMQ68_09755 [Chryseobacterium sp. ERMR1:04]